MSTYNKLFEITANKLNMSDAEKADYNYAILVSTASKAKEIDYKCFENINGTSLYIALYYAAFQKLPSENEIEGTNNYSDEEIVKNVCNMAAFYIRDLKVINCPYQIKRNKLKANIYKCLNGIKNSIALRKLAKKMPSGIQNKIRGLFG